MKKRKKKGSFALFSPAAASDSPPRTPAAASGLASSLADRCLVFGPLPRLLGRRQSPSLRAAASPPHSPATTLSPISLTGRRRWRRNPLPPHQICPLQIRRPLPLPPPRLWPAGSPLSPLPAVVTASGFGLAAIASSRRRRAPFSHWPPRSSLVAHHRTRCLYELNYSCFRKVQSKK